MTWIKDHRWLLIVAAAILLVALYLISIGAFGIGTGGVTGDQGPATPP
jgi:uncharacterized membrane protein